MTLLAFSIVFFILISYLFIWAHEKDCAAKVKSTVAANVRNKGSELDAELILFFSDNPIYLHSFKAPGWQIASIDEPDFFSDEFELERQTPSVVSDNVD